MNYKKSVVALAIVCMVGTATFLFSQPNRPQPKKRAANVGNEQPPGQQGKGLIDKVASLERKTAAIERETAFVRPPIGGILAFAGDAASLQGSCWALCDGTALPADADKKLHEKLKGKTPKLMDAELGGVFLAGLPAAQIGATGGRKDIPSDGAHRHTGTTNNGDGHIGWIPGTQFHSQGNKTYSQKYSFTTSLDGGHAHGGENRPSFYGVCYIIRIR